MGVVKLESWSYGRVTFVGDAAYCPSVNIGMSTTSGIVGAYILVGEVGWHCGCSDIEDADVGDDTYDGLAIALKAYEQKFRPFID
jgi:2-polyprenyl-6-methoxyphenol hydroxylase-like FAD-dependent oxidoreductase